MASIVHCNNNAKHFNKGQIPIKETQIQFQINKGHVKNNSKVTIKNMHNGYLWRYFRIFNGAPWLRLADAAIGAFLQIRHKLVTPERPAPQA